MPQLLRTLAAIAVAAGLTTNSPRIGHLHVTADDLAFTVPEPAK